MQVLFSIFFLYGPIIFALCGFIVAYYVYNKKRTARPMVCPLNGHCEAVTTSKYSKFAGVPVEVAGLVYYGFIILFYTAHLLLPYLFSDVVMFFATAFTVGAFFFSCYLVAIQAFVLKQWCTWCLFSAGFSTLIFLTAIFAASFNLVDLLAQYKGVVVFFHALAAALGVGAATVTDVFFFKFLKDYKISKREADLLSTLSHIIWVALGILIITGIGLYIPQSERLLDSSKFLTKMVAVGVITLNGLVLNLFISPRLTEIVYGKEHEHKVGELHVFRKIVFASGGVSIVSWYTVFILGSLRSIPIRTEVALLIYVGLLFVAIIGGQLYDMYLLRQRKNIQEEDLIKVSQDVE